MIKNGKLIIALLPLMMLASCGSNGSMRQDEITQMLVDAAYNLLYEKTGEYKLFVRQNDGKKFYYYEELFGTSNNEEFIVQYDYVYSYKYYENINDEVKNDIKEAVNLNYDKIKEMFTSFTFEYESVLDNETKITKQINVENPSKDDVGLVVIDQYLPFALTYNYSAKVCYFALPINTTELKKIDNNIIDTNGQTKEFASFIKENEMSLK
jgi:hypothetical protein